MDQSTLEKVAAQKISGIPMGVESGAPKEAPAQEPAEQPVTQVEDQTAQGAESDQQQTESVQEMEEVDFDGVKFQILKEHAPQVRDALMRTADYTRKTQEVADRARVVAEQERLFQAQSQFHKDSIDDIAQIKALDQAIAQYANVNWMGMQLEELTRTRLQYDQLKEARERATKSLNEKWGKFNSERESHLKRLEQAGRDEAARRISGFTDKTAQEIRDYAKSRGYSDQQISMLFYNPTDIEMIWKARQFDNLQGAKGVVNQRVNKAPPVLKPGATQQQKSESEKQLVSFYAEKNPARKQKLGEQILARKMRLN